MVHLAGGLLQEDPVGVRELQGDWSVAGKLYGGVEGGGQATVTKGGLTVGGLRAPADKAGVVINRRHKVSRKQPRTARGTDVKIVPGVVDAGGAVQKLAVRRLEAEAPGRLSQARTMAAPEPGRSRYSKRRLVHFHGDERQRLRNVEDKSKPGPAAL